MKPILFNADMVRAIRKGTKTATRRPIKLIYSNTHLERRTDKYGTRLIEIQNEEPGVTTVRNPDGTTTHTLLAAIERTPPYHPGDILYVRETWRKDVERYMYKADYSENEKFYRNGKEVSIKWHPSIHMPREAARIFLRVTNVRVERLQEISEESATQEGCTPLIKSVRYVFADLWDRTIKRTERALYGWNANPYVWVIAFERCEKPEGD